MPQHDDFLRAILADPDEDAPRLVYADWLDERGDPRGEFIRLQIERARLDEYDPRQTALEQREGELFARYGMEWVAPFAPLLNVRGSGVEWGSGDEVGCSWQSWFDRGFVGRLSLRAKGFLRCADGLLRLAPLQWLELRVARGEVSRLSRCPSLARIPWLALASLDNRGLDPGTMGILAASDCLTGLRQLGLPGNHIGDRGVDALANASWLTGVQELNLASNRITADGIRSLADSNHLGPLSALRLSHNLRIEDEGAAALAAHPALATLSSLSLARCGLGPAGAEALIRSPTLAGVSELDLSVNDLGPAVAEQLAGAMNLRLKTLILSECGLGDEGVLLLASWPGLAHLHRLDLGDNWIGATGAEALAASPYLGRLRVLDLSDNNLSDEELSRLAEAPTLQHLHRLETRINIPF